MTATSAAEAVLDAAPSQTESGELLRVSFELQDGGVLRPREEGVDGPALRLIDGAGKQQVFLPIMMR